MYSWRIKPNRFITDVTLIKENPFAMKTLICEIFFIIFGDVLMYFEVFLKNQSILVELS